MRTDPRAAIAAANTALGIEFGSTRIKAVLIGPDHEVLATGGHGWENYLEGGLWSYRLDEVVAGLQSAYASLVADVRERYDVTPTSYGSIGISAMMHGYLAFDADDSLLAPFRTWRNTNTGRAADELTRLFGFNIPLRWSIAHLHQAVLDSEEHAPRVAHLTTLAGWVHYRLTGRRVLGVGDASGMFPIDSQAGTGMIATNAIAQRTGNISCGTSVFLMAVLECSLTELHTEIDMVTTPDGSPVAMVHSNNGASEIDAWVGWFADFARLVVADVSVPAIYDALYTHALTGEADAGGVMAYNTLSAEPLVGQEAAQPVFTHTAEACVNLANAVRAQLMSVFAAVRIGTSCARRGCASTRSSPMAASSRPRASPSRSSPTR